MSTSETLNHWKDEVILALKVYEKYTGFRFFEFTGNNTDLSLDHENYLNFVVG